MFLSISRVKFYVKCGEFFPFWFRLSRVRLLGSKVSITVVNVFKSEGVIAC